MKQKNSFLILDFGSQYTWLIARCFRELGYYSQVEAFDFPLEDIQKLKPAGIVLSGGPSSVLSEGAPTRSLKELVSIAPLLGVCYGLQLICHQWGGKVLPSEKRTYGNSLINWKKEFLSGLKQQRVWMSHGDSVDKLPDGFSILAETSTKIPACIQSDNILALQFHPEVSHTERGKDLLKYFVQEICSVGKGEWTPAQMLHFLEEDIQVQLKSSDHVLCALSGGVDSTVTAILLTKVLGFKKVRCVFVDTGLLRKNEFQEVLNTYKKLNLNVEGVDAKEEFLQKLKNVVDPEKKRKIIGHTFIDIFKKYKESHGELNCLAQGTLYPDVIESLSVKGPSATIKSHHNVGGLPKDMPFKKLIEPLKYLFKDEVRLLGKELNIPEIFLNRHPFPGPGLAVRICGEITEDRLTKLQSADAIFIEELKQADLYDQIWQAFCVLLPVKSVGVQGDERTYDEVIVLRAITSTDGMTADWFDFDSDFLHKVSDRITNEVKGINRVVYDITSKPPGTIEWL